MADELDNIALRILDLLAADGRMSYQAIADEVGLSRPAVMERVKRLEESGYITGYHAHIDRARIGRPDHRLCRGALSQFQRQRARARHPEPGRTS